MTDKVKDWDGFYSREHFEKGCLCIFNGTLEKKPASVDNWEAVKFYEENCKCSRNYI